MSTRCQIGFYQSEQVDLRGYEALLYRHSDGYPGTLDGKQYGLLSEIIPFLTWFDNTRGMSDIEYCAARLLQYLANGYDIQTKEMAKRYDWMKPTIPGEFTGVLGYGICKDLHPDIDFFYAISPGMVRVFEPHFADRTGKYAPLWHEWRLLETVNIVKELVPVS